MAHNKIFACSAFILTLLLGACSATETPQSTNNSGALAPTASAIHTEVTSPVSAQHDGITYDFAIHDDLYTLRSNGVAIGADAAEASIYFEGWQPDARYPLTFARHEGLFYAIAIDERNGGLCLEVFDETGKLLRTSKPFPSSVTIASEMVFCDGIMYICAGNIRLGTQSVMALYAYDAESETLTKMQNQVSALAAYTTGQIAYVTDDGVVVYDCVSQTETLHSVPLPFQVMSFGRLASENSMYAVTLNNESVYSLTRLDLADNSFEHLRPLQGTNGSQYFITRVLATDTQIYMKYTQDDFFVIENRGNDWGTKADALEILSLTTSDRTPRSLAVFNNIYGNALAYMHEELGYQYPDVHVTHQTLLSSNGLYISQVDLNALLDGGAYDLVLFDDNITMALTDDSALADLHEIPALRSMFDGMLDGIENLCTVNGKLMGAPNIMSTSGFFVNRMNLIANGGQMPLRGWTIADYQEMAAAAKNQYADTAALIHQGDIYPLFNAIGCNILAGNIPSDDEYTQLLGVYSALLSDGLLRGMDGENPPTDSTNAVFAGHDISAATDSDITSVHFPLYSQNAKIPVRLDVLALTAQAADRQEAIDFLQAYMHPDVLKKTSISALNDGGGMGSVFYLPIWYEDAELWADYPALADYAYLLQNSIHQYTFNWAFGIASTMNYHANGSVPEESTWRSIHQWPEYDAFVEFAAHGSAH